MLSPCEEGVRVFLHRTGFAWPVVDGEAPEPQSLWLQEDGTFAFDGLLPGDYRVYPYCPAPGVYLKSARFDGADVPGRGFAMSAGAHVLEVVFSTRAGPGRATGPAAAAAPRAGGAGRGGAAQQPTVLSRNGKDFTITGNGSTVRAGTEIRV